MNGLNFDLWGIEIIHTIGNCFRVVLLTLTTSGSGDGDILHQTSEHDQLGPAQHQAVEDGLLRSID